MHKASIIFGTAVAAIVMSCPAQAAWTVSQLQMVLAAHNIPYIQSGSELQLMPDRRISFHVSFFFNGQQVDPRSNQLVNFIKISCIPIIRDQDEAERLYRMVDIINLRGGAILAKTVEDEDTVGLVLMTGWADRFGTNPMGFLYALRNLEQHALRIDVGS